MQGCVMHMLYNIKYCEFWSDEALKFTISILIAGCLSVDGRLCEYGYLVSQLPVIWEWGLGMGFCFSDADRLWARVNLSSSG